MLRMISPPKLISTELTTIKLMAKTRRGGANSIGAVWPDSTARKAGFGLSATTSVSQGYDLE
jgi:hypothetical protein